MNIVIHRSGDLSQAYPEKWAEFATACGLSWEFVDLTRTFSLHDISRRFDAILCRWSLSYPGRSELPVLLDILENEYGMLVYPDRRTRWSWDDKIRQSVLFEQHGVRTPRTYIFRLEDEALEWARSTSYPVVFKLASGASSRNVVLVYNYHQARRLITAMFVSGIPSGGHLAAIRDGRTPRQLFGEWKRRLFAQQKWRHIRGKETVEKSYAYFQELVSDNMFDTRISIIGDRAFGFRRFNRKDDFRASGSGRIDWDPSKIDIQTVRTGFALNEKCGFQCMAYDFVRDKTGENLLLEACWTFADWAVQKCPGHWNANLEWVPGSMWPEEAQIQDLIRLMEARRR